MKTIITVLSVFLFGFAQALIDYEDECITEMKADKDEMMHAFRQDPFPEDNLMFKEVLSCSWKKEGLMDKSGNMVLENMRQFLVYNIREARGCNDLIASSIATDTIHHCGEVRGNSSGDTAVKMGNCILRRLDSYRD